MFAPAKNALAFTEPLVGYGVVGSALGAAGLSEAGVFNVLCLLGIAFSLWATARLAVAYGCGRLPALLGAAAACLGAETACGFGYVSFVVFGGIPLALLAWKSARETGKPASVLGLGVALAGLGWFSLQLLAFCLAALGAVVLLDALTDARTRTIGTLGSLAAGLGLAALLLAPLARHMLAARHEHGFVRSEPEAAMYSAAPADWLATTSVNPGQAFLSRRSDSEKALYPGSVALALAALSVVGAARGGVRLVAVGLVLVAVSFTGSLGPSGPLAPLLKAVAPPIFGGIRAFARFGAVSQVGMGLLAASGVTFLFARLSSSRARIVAASALAAAIAVDVRQTIRFGFRPERPRAAVEEFLARAETGGPILHLPLYHSSSDSRWLFSSLLHGKPLVNGCGSYIPKRNQDLAAALAETPISTEVLAVLRDWPTGVVVVHEHALPLRRLRPTLAFMEAGLASGIFAPPLRFSHGDGDDWLFFVRHGDAPPVGTDDEGSFHRHAAAAPAVPDAEDAGFGASIDEPPPGRAVHGTLGVRGWSQTAAGPGEILEIRIDHDRRATSALVRTARPDVEAALPALGSCATAGYEATIAMREGDVGTRVLRVAFRAPDGRVRTLEREFEWLP